MVTLLAVNGNQIRVTESASGGRGPRGGAMQGQGDQAMPARGRRGMGSRNQTSTQGTHLVVPESATVTYAMTERRTNEFKVGASINGRLRNSIFQNIPREGLPARIVFKGNLMVELNILQANDTSLEDIAVKPKRPPMKKS